MEKQIKLAARMYQCRDLLKKLHGKDFDEKMVDYKRYIKAAMVKHKLDNEILAAMKLIEECKDIDGADAAAMNILAACVEILEPSKI